jgi:cytoskeletal protein CcmA (bactofilin family)
VPVGTDWRIPARSSPKTTAKQEKTMQALRFGTAGKRFFLGGLAILAVAAGSSSVPAFQARAGKHVLVPAGEVVADDLYAGADTVTIDGTVKGDLVAWGRLIRVKGTVEGDLIAGAQAISIEGTVGDDARIAGQVLLLKKTARVGGDIVAGAYSLEAEAGSVVGGDLVYGGYQALLAGNVGGGVRGAMAGLDLRGSVTNDVNVSTAASGEGSNRFQFMPPAPIPAPQLEPGLTVGHTARIGGRLNYKSTDRGYIDPAAEVKGGVNWEKEIAPEAAEKPMDIVLRYLKRFISLVIAALVMLLVVPGWTRSIAGYVQNRPWPSLGWGVLTFLLFVGVVVAFPIVTVLLLVLFGVLTLGNLAWLFVGVGFCGEVALLLAGYVFLAYVAHVAIGLLVGRLLLRQAGTTFGSTFGMAVLGLAVLVVAGAIPFLGWVISELVALLGCGALWMWIRGHRGGRAAVGG